MKIEDGKGSGKLAQVSSDNRLDTSSRQNPRRYYISRDTGQLYNVVSTFNATTGNIVFSIENESTSKKLYVEEIHLASQTTCAWNVYRTESGDVPAGTTLTAVNMNFESSNAPDAGIFGNAAVTGITNTSTGLIAILQTSAYSDEDTKLSDGLILGKNDGFNVALTGNGTVSVTVEFYLE